MRMDRIVGVVTMLLMAALLVAPGYAGAGWVDVRDYFPEGWEDEEQLDLRDEIQQAVNENGRVYFPGSDDPDQPRLYHTTVGIEVPAHTHLRFGPNHRLVRLPSQGRLLNLEDHVRLTGAIINGNKYEHWPEYQELGKSSEAAVAFGSHNLIQDTVVYDNPGHAFSSRGDYNKLYRCRAENIGYIDVRFGARFYQGRWDGYSGDGFYLRGEGNLVKDSEAYDTFRWDFCSSHSGARQNTYVDCRGGDINYDTYGFIDIEQAEDNNRLIRCISPNSRIAIPVTHRTEVIQCMASEITVWDRPESIERYEDEQETANHGVVLNGNILTEGGLAVGGYDSSSGEITPGVSSPVIVNNRIYKTNPDPAHQVDWSFSVYSIDGEGVVANNILFEYEDEQGTRGPGMNLMNVEGRNNQVVHGQWDLDLPSPYMIYGAENAEFIERRAEEYAEELLGEHLADIEFEGQVRSVHWLPTEVAFIQDPHEEGEERGWHQAAPEDEGGLRNLRVNQHWDFALGGEYHGTGWYYFPVEWPDEVDEGQVYLFFSGIDSHAEIFVDGEMIGDHEGWQTPAFLRVEDAHIEKDGERLIATKVWTPGGLGGLYGAVGIVVVE